MQKSKWTLAVFFTIVFVLFTVGAHATTYYVDFANGSDQNVGTSQSYPFKHSPGDTAGIGTSQTTNLESGDVVLFRGGITYKGKITLNSSGRLVLSGNMATISDDGTLRDLTSDFVSAGIVPGDYVYVYHSKDSQENTWVESTGLFKVKNIPNANTIGLEGFSGVSHLIPEITYLVYRPIVFGSDPSYGSGAPVLDGENIRPVIFDINGHDYVMIKNLILKNTQDDGSSSSAAIRTSADIDGLSVVNCEFVDLGVSGVTIGLGSNYYVAKNNTATRVGYNGIGGAGYYLLQENNTIIGPGCRGGLGGYRYAIIRNNYVKDMTQQWEGKHQDGIGFIDGGPLGDNYYGWIYGNTIDNTVESIAMYETGEGTHYWTIHSNILIGRVDETGFGDAGILMRGSSNNKIFNNLFFAPVGKGFINDIRFARGNSNISIFNNIFFSNTSSTVLNIPSDSISGLTVDYNQYYNPVDDPIIYSGDYKTIIQWQNLGFDSHGRHLVNGDPKFSSPTQFNLTLELGSPAINAGKNLDTFFTLDKKGFNKSGLSWDLGPYEYEDVRPSKPLGLLIVGAIDTCNINVLFSG